MNKKLVSIVMAVILAVACLAGCGNQNSTNKSGDVSKSEASTASSQQASSQGASQEASVDEIPNFNPEGYPIVNEPITLSVLWCISDTIDLMPFEELQIIQELEATTGINLEAELVRYSDFSNRLNLLFAAGEYPDIIFCSQGTVDYEEYGVTQQIVVPLDDLIEKYLPEYNERNAKSDIDLGVALRATDGQLYTLPFLRGTSGSLQGIPFFINSEWLETLNLKSPTSIDELTDVLRAFKEKDPNGNGKADEIPLACTADYLPYFLNLFGLPGAGSGNLWINDEKKVEFVPTTDAYRECLEWMHQLYKEELLDVEMFSIDLNAHRAKVNKLLVGAFCSNTLNGLGIDNTIGKYDFWYSDRSRYSMGLGFSSNDSVYLTCTNEHKEASMRLINYMLEIENQEDFYLGPQDHPEDGWKYNEEGLIEDYNLRTGEARSVDMVRFSNCAPSIVPSYLFNEKYVKSPGQVERFEYGDTLLASKNYVKYSIDYLKLVKIDGETQEKISLIKADMASAILEHRANFIKNGVTDKSWDDYCKIFKDMNVDYLLQVYQDGIDALDVKETKQ